MKTFLEKLIKMEKKSCKMKNNEINLEKLIKMKKFPKKL